MLTPDEMSGDPDAVALLEALIQQIADQLGVDPSTIQITCEVVPSQLCPSSPHFPRLPVLSRLLRYHTVLTNFRVACIQHYKVAVLV